MKKYIFLFLLAGIMLIGCNTTPELNDLPETDLPEESYYSPFNKFDSIIDLDVNRGKDGKYHVSCEVFQTLHEKEGLAKMWSYDVVYVVSDMPVFDGMKITETDTKKFKILGTYTYYTVDDTRKTVPVISLFDIKNN